MILFIIDNLHFYPVYKLWIFDNRRWLAEVVNVQPIHITSGQKRGLDMAEQINMKKPNFGVFCFQGDLAGFESHLLFSISPFGQGE
jgi:hypothetical protein